MSLQQRYQCSKTCSRIPKKPLSSSSANVTPMPSVTPSTNGSSDPSPSSSSISASLLRAWKTTVPSGVVDVADSLELDIPGGVAAILPCLIDLISFSTRPSLVSKPLRYLSKSLISSGVQAKQALVPQTRLSEGPSRRAALTFSFWRMRCSNRQSPNLVQREHHAHNALIASVFRTQANYCLIAWRSRRREPPKTYPTVLERHRPQGELLTLFRL